MIDVNEHARAFAADKRALSSGECPLCKEGHLWNETGHQEPVCRRRAAVHVGKERPELVAKNQKLSLGPGSYGKVEVKHGGTLILTGGLYQILSLDVAQKARVLFKVATEIRIKTELDTNAKAKLVLDPGVPGLSASQVVISPLARAARTTKWVDESHRQSCSRGLS